MADLTGRRVLVTGGGRGIGAAIAIHLADRGAAVALTYRRDADAAAATAERAGATALHLDLAEQETVDTAVHAAAETLGGLDAVIANAGVASSGRYVADTLLDELNRVLAVHATGPHQLCRAALPHLRAAASVTARADIVFVSSVVTRAPMAGGAPYTMGKAAVEALAACLAREERVHGVRVNVVAPGLVDTEMGRRLVHATRDVEDIRDLDAASPFGRVCAPDDIAEVVGFLLGAAYLTDQRITIDGGTFR